jgi:archaellum component FlaC
MINKRYIEISDEEYERVNTAIESYSNAIQEVYDNLQIVTFSEQQRSKLLHQLDQLEADIKSLKQDIFYVEEDGLYFTDDNGNVAASLDPTGVHTIGEARDLSITDY